MTSTVRRAIRGDAEAIRKVASESWHTAYGPILGRETVEEKLDDWYAVDGLERSIEEAATEEDAFFVVAELEDRSEPEQRFELEDRSEPAASGDRIVGFAHVVSHSEFRSIASLARIYVRPDHWGNGIGRAMLADVERYLTGKYDRLRLAVLADNEIGVRFYESTGFDRIETRSCPLGDGLEEYIYEKSV